VDESVESSGALDQVISMRDWFGGVIQEIHL
jgi:hypothetical protein